jgi:hypothetical protein
MLFRHFTCVSKSNVNCACSADVPVWMAISSPPTKLVAQISLSMGSLFSCAESAFRRKLPRALAASGARRMNEGCLVGQ